MQKESMPKTLLIDLDGVLNTYSGEYDKLDIAPPREGVGEFLKVIAQNYKIEIFTVRDKQLTQKWLEKYHLSEFVSDITNIKSPYASIIIDDRALKFNGNFSETLKEISSFKTHWE